MHQTGKFTMLDFMPGCLSTSMTSSGIEVECKDMPVIDARGLHLWFVLFIKIDMTATHH